MTVKRHLISSALNAADGNNEEGRIRYCARCMDMFGVVARLGPRIMPLDETTGKPKPKPLDYDYWLECHNCGTIYPKHEVKIEPEIASIKEPSDGRRAKIVGADGRNNKKKGTNKGRGNNPRLRNKRDEIKDQDLIRELKDGAVLLSYSSSDPL